MRLFPAAVWLLVVVPATAAEVDYQRDIKPLLLHKCGACHGALRQQAGLRLDAGQLIRKGGESGPAVEPGNSAASLLLERVTETDETLRMPPTAEGEALTADQITLLKDWINQGAKSPDDEQIPEDPAAFWSYQSPSRPAVPEVKSKAWVRTPIDAFIASAREQHGLVASAEARPEVWLRRVYLDLIGLPPTREELHEFLGDTSDTAYESVVDRLLSRPEYGERWGRHWMDVWRYSDWYGSRSINEIRYSQRHIWRWRDWIVDSINADKSYDRMILEMLAGDELAPADPDVLRATGFLGRNWYKFDRNVWMFETVEQTSQAFLGLTLRCARCHDHKYDPISQEEYYRFRAFFEPHDVRTDPLAADTAMQKDATLGMVLTDGVSRTFDKELDTETYLFQRGDNRYPDTSHPLTPGVPASLGGPEITIQPISLPPEAWYPYLRPELSDGLIEVATEKTREAETALQTAKAAVTTRENAIAAFESRVARTTTLADGTLQPILVDDFSTRQDVWKVLSGDWTWEKGQLAQRAVSSFATIYADVTHPRDFVARVKYRTLEAGMYRSVGFSFDFIDTGNSQDVYTSTGDAAQSVQAFHRRDGKQEYPQAGIVKTPLRVGEVNTVEVTVRGQQLSITLNGEPKLDYVMPVPRRDGKFALWVHNGAVEFLEVELRELLPTIETLRREHQTAVNQVALAEQQLQTATAELQSVRARVAAERARYLSGTEAEIADADATAVQAERELAVARASEGVLKAEQHLASVIALQEEQAEAKQSGESTDSTNHDKARTEAEQQLMAARKVFAQAEADREQKDSSYAPLGEQYPTTSTGRRLALARWIASPQNPRTARIAVNHIWLRHFGQALVPSVANFGLNGKSPSHPELLDWLAAELVDHEWRMKPIHRQIVLSATYRQSSVEEDNPAAEQCRSIDPENKWLWKMLSRRMEAEVVRDSVLHTAGSLDLTRGGPEIAESNGQTDFRRSLYFRNTPNEKMPFLATFDAPNPNECYRRQESVVPQQALALMNSGLAVDQARLLAKRLVSEIEDKAPDAAETKFITAAFETILSREPDSYELDVCRHFLKQNSETSKGTASAAFPGGDQTFHVSPSTDPHQRARENLIHVLYNHNDFVTIR